MSDSRTQESKSKESDIGKLIRDGVDDQTVISHLKSKYNDKELVAKAFSEYEERMSKIRRKAQKFAQLVISRYSHLGTKRIMEKAMKLKKKYNFPDDDFAAFVNIALSDKSVAQSGAYNIPNTPLSKIFGHTQDATTGKMSYKANELSLLQEILKLHNDNMAIHQQVVTQSLLYRDCDFAALTGTFKQDKMQAYNYVHPVVAALFFPRLKYLDEHMLIGSVTNIVQTRFNGVQIRNNPDWELYWDMITDPNEIACAAGNSNPIADLKNRAVLQIELWKQVRELRQGRYYSADSASFMTALFNCRNNVFDAPDMMYVKDEGSILRKLFGAMSLRPTIVSLSTLGSSQMTGSYSINPLAMTQVSTIPIVNFRLPGFKTAGVKYNLTSALSQPDWYVENKMLVSKTKQIIYSRDLIVFYVNRRYNKSINYSRLTAPYNFSRLPTSYSGFEIINDTPISYVPEMTIGDASFSLKSTVFLESTELPNIDANNESGTPNQLIVGCSTGIVLSETTNAALSGRHIIYDPIKASTFNDEINAIDGHPIHYFTQVTESDGQTLSFAEKFETSGTIYMYVKNKF